MEKRFLAAALFLSAFAFGQKVSSQLRFAKGQSLEVVTNMNINGESMVGPSSGNITVTDVYSVNDVAPNAITLTKAPKQIKMNFSVMSQEIKIDTDKPGEMNSMLAQPVKEIMSQKPEFTIDAAGKITAVKKDDKKKDNAPAGLTGMMLPGMDMISAVPRVGNASFFQVLPANREVSPGDTWTDSVNTEGNKNVTVYKVKSITGNEVVLDFSGEGTSVTENAAMGMNVKVNAATTTTGNIVVDRATGILKQRTSTSSVETKMDLGGREVTSTMKATMVTNVTPM